MEWNALLAVLVGATVGLVGDQFGRRSMRRDVDRQEERAFERDLRREAVLRSRRAAEDILESFRVNVIRLTATYEEADLRDRVNSICRTVSASYVHFPSAELRRRLWIYGDVMDLSKTGIPVGEYSTQEVAFVAKAECGRVLGAWLRGEERHPEPCEDWHAIEDGYTAVVAVWRQEAASRGIRVHFPETPEGS